MSIPATVPVALVLFVAVAVSGLWAQSDPDDPAAKALDDLLTAPSVWTLDADGFQEAYSGYGFAWTSATKEAARADGKRVPLTLFGKPVGETIVMFKGANPKQIQVSLHNRGDDGSMREEKFFTVIEDFKKSLSAKTGVSAVDRGKDNKSATRAEGFQWTTETTAYLLEFSAQAEVKTRDIPFRSEFIRLRAAKAVKQTFMEAALAKEERITRADLPSNVVRKDGDTFIQGVPMVDQGEKGYCVVASTARVFGYYGMQVDQHEIAQIANASATEGTNSTGMIDALDRIAGRVKVRVKTHDEMEYGDLIDLVGDYNRQAKRKGGDELTTDSGYNMWNHFDAFDPGTLKETRMRDAAGFKGFKSEIERSIDAGVPLLWTVTVGLFPEEKINPQSRGGHMRMIIGYNWEKNQVIYSDSWGEGHEFKRWGIEEAFSSTHGLYSVQPIR